MEVTGICSVCGRHTIVHTCTLCGQPVCADHLDVGSGTCARCAGRSKDPARPADPRPHEGTDRFT